jgi:serine/threonine protein kinase/CRP-like cAMP-binding protein
LIKEGTVRCTQQKMDREVQLIDLAEGEYFGEMALLLDEPRHANCIAVGNVEVMSLEKDNFVKLLGPVKDILARQMRIRVLKSVPLLARLSDMELDQVGDAMRVQIFSPGDYIIREGEIGQRFYIINEGEVKCCKKNAEGKEEQIQTFKEQDFFGEQALLHAKPRGASCIAVDHVECLVLERDHFQNLLGDLSNEIDKMAQSRSTTSSSSTSDSKPVGPSVDYAFNDLNLLRMLGTGTFGRVKLVQHRPTGTVAALKCMMKAQITNCHQEKNIMNEKNLLYACAHTFVLQLLSTYSDHDQIYMLMELVQGGELWSYVYDKFDLIPRTKIGGFTKQHTQFYAGCVISAFSLIHGKGIAYRDLKPENLLMDSAGYVKVIDFGFAKHIPYEKNGSLQTKSFTLCGTPEYLSPELVLSRGHDKSVDYWALGCLIYELLVGNTPFQDDNQNEIFKKIIHSHKSLAFPKGIDSDAVDLIKKLLAPNPAFRIGNLMGGVSEIQQHPFFNDFSWQTLQARQVPAPYVPHIKGAMDVDCFDDMGDEEDVVIPYTGPQKYFEEF